NCQKEGHYQSECYQLVGYPVGHPLHGKFKPGNSGQNRTTNFKPRAVNMVTGHSVGQETNGGGDASTSGTKADDTVFAKMDSFQNQLNQVMLMLQNSQGMVDPKLLAADGLYIIKSEATSRPTPPKVLPTPATVLSHSCNLHLWHARLGHPSTHVIIQIKQLPTFTTDVSKLHCTICPIAKQTALPFMSSTSHATSLFELIHADTWGPYHHTKWLQILPYLNKNDSGGIAILTALIPSILLGYPQHQKGYLLLAQNTKKVFVSRHVTFHEHIFPFHTNTPYYTSPIDPTTSTPIFYLEPNTPSNSSTLPEPTPSTSTHTTSSLPLITPTYSPIQDNHNSPNDTTIESPTTPKQHSSTTIPTTTTPTTNTTPSTTTSPPTNAPPPSPPPFRKSQRTRAIPTKLKDFQHYQPSSTNSVITKHHTSHFINYNNIQNPTTLHFLNSITHETKPTSYTQASKNPKWVEAMNNEISALESNHTWELTTLPHNKHAIG
ncbi:cysteine-rich receptor-like protein kinase 8, partial [Tanacetum coccineum]